MSPETVLSALHWMSAALGALYVLTLVVNIANPLIALRWPRLAAVLSTMGGHVGDARKELDDIAKFEQAASYAAKGGA